MPTMLLLPLPLRMRPMLLRVDSKCIRQSEAVLSAHDLCDCSCRIAPNPKPHTEHATNETRHEPRTRTRTTRTNYKRTKRSCATRCAPKVRVVADVLLLLLLLLLSSCCCCCVRACALNRLTAQLQMITRTLKMLRENFRNFHTKNFSNFQSSDDANVNVSLSVCLFVCICVWAYIQQTTHTHKHTQATHMCVFWFK